MRDVRIPKGRPAHLAPDGAARQPPALMDVAGLAGLLRETAEHHGAFEAVAPPHDWWDWYAAYMVARQGGASAEEAAAAGDAYMAEVKNVIASRR